jgi:hypothetical protein
MTLAMVQQRKGGEGKKKIEKKVPEVVTSAKFLMQEKKDAEKAAEKDAKAAKGGAAKPAEGAKAAEAKK